MFIGGCFLKEASFFWLTRGRSERYDCAYDCWRGDYKNYYINGYTIRVNIRNTTFLLLFKKKNGKLIIVKILSKMV